MKLLTKELLNQFEKQGKTDQTPDEQRKVIAKYFNPLGAQTWYAIEYNPEEKMFFGFADLGFKGMEEFGYFSLDELKNIELPFGMSIERDLYFDQMTVKKLKTEYKIPW